MNKFRYSLVRNINPNSVDSKRSVDLIEATAAITSILVICFCDLNMLVEAEWVESSKFAAIGSPTKDIM